jgi:uncharacterized membrane protein
MENLQPWRFAHVCADGALQWRMRRNCSVTPMQLLSLFATLALLSLGIAVFFWWQGALLVLPFTLLELLALGVAFRVYARHATDGEVVDLQADGLRVQREEAGVVTTDWFEPSQVRIGLPEKPSDLIAIRAGRRELRLGRHVRPEVRRVLGREIRKALGHGNVGAC